MRSFRPAVLVLAVCGLALAGCGGSDDEDTAASTSTTTPPVTTTAPSDSAVGAGTTTSSTTSTGDTDGRAGTSGGAGTETTADDEVPSGGVSPSTGSPNGRKNAGGDQPTITAGTADRPATAIADDASLIELWCDQARQGAYDDLVGDATSLVVTVRGSDDSRTCELPR